MSPPTTSPDHFGRKTDKLGVLFGATRSARVLLAGSGDPDWEADVRSSFATLTVARTAEEFESALSREGAFDLVIWTPGLVLTPGWQLMKRLGRSLSENGTAFILTENRFSARATRRDPLRVFSSTRTTLASFQRLLERAGFDRTHGFLPVPDLRGAEEFVSSRYGAIALPTHAARLEDVLNRAGLLWTIHDGAAFIASGHEGGERRLMKELGQLLEGPHNTSSREIVLERFDLRERGALIVFLRSENTRMVCRIAVETTVDRVIRRNNDWIRRMHDAPHLTADLKAAVPHSLGAFPVTGGNAYVETLIPGVIAWKLSGSPRREARLFRSVTRFITNLGRESATRVRIDESHVDRLLSQGGYETIDPHVSLEYEQLGTQLRARMLGRERTLAWVHGDFGYGNVIADPKTGELSGVIDWDQAMEGLAGEDLVNFLVQRERAMRGRSLSQALEEVGEAVVAGGFRAFDSRLTHDQDIVLTTDEREEIMAWTTLRFAQRGMAYPALFAPAREETRVALAWACEMLSGRKPPRPPIAGAKPVPVLFIHRGGDLIRGSEEALLTFLDGLDRTRFLPSVVCSSPVFERAVQERGIKCRVEAFPEILVDFSSASVPLIRYTRALNKLITAARADGIGMVFASGGGPCQLAVPMASRLGIPCVCLFHHPAPRSYYQFWRIAKVDALIFTSRFTAEHTRDMVGKTGTVVYVGIDSEHFSPSPRNDDPLRRSHGIGRGDIVFAQVGALAPYKGHDVLLDAFQRVRQTVGSARLLIIGDGVNALSISEVVRERGLSDSVTLTGFVDDVTAYFREVIDINVLASREEGMGLVNLQASSCGLPNIASDCTGIREAVLHGRTGLLFEPGNATALAGCMVELARDASMREDMGRAGRNFILDNFSISGYVEQVQDLMSRTLREFGRTP